MVTKDLDRYEWMQETARNMRLGELRKIDPGAIADWLDEMSKSDAREVRNRLACLIEHRLKLGYVTGPELERNRRGWELTTNEQLRQLDDIFDESPSLRNQFTPELLSRTYHRVSKDVARVYEVKLPVECPYTYAELINGAA
jgi:Domain of unknown function DUF29